METNMDGAGFPLQSVLWVAVFSSSLALFSGCGLFSSSFLEKVTLHFGVSEFGTAPFRSIPSWLLTLVSHNH